MPRRQNESRKRRAATRVLPRNLVESGGFDCARFIRIGNRGWLLLLPDDAMASRTILNCGLTSFGLKTAISTNRLAE
jgi:hypothetical protein